MLSRNPSNKTEFISDEQQQKGNKQAWHLAYSTDAVVNMHKSQGSYFFSQYFLIILSQSTIQDIVKYRPTMANNEKDFRKELLTV